MSSQPPSTSSQSINPTPIDKSNGSHIDTPSASTRSPIKAKMVSLVRPRKARAARLHTEKPYSRMAPKLKLSQKVPIPICAILRESTHTTALEPLAAVPSGTSIVSQALASKSSLEAPAAAGIESKAYCNVESEAYHDVALIQKSIGCRVPNLDENSTEIELNTVTPADIPVLWTHDKNPRFHLKKHPQLLPCIGPYAVYPMLLVLDADPLREPEKGLLLESNNDIFINKFKAVIFSLCVQEAHKKFGEWAASNGVTIAEFNLPEVFISRLATGEEWLCLASHPSQIALKDFKTTVMEEEPNTDLLAMTLHAFSHFSYEHGDSKTVFRNFIYTLGDNAVSILWFQCDT
ncbi:hypothetical protein BT96DRAFT_1008898 [Gymnopus androsaceus JB14]|uniref:Uncharacterized protein n=1 Tax=Gymnopus androsaceus JB14 TaxID=1447944 RepID=A0A6A4GDP9_9AGAR|nr:hypothetical protein BT96DRAFT_1008898 [Gymnopus androsaceus JB14]